MHRVSLVGVVGLQPRDLAELHNPRSGTGFGHDRSHCAILGIVDLNGIRAVAVGVPDHTGGLMRKRVVVENCDAVQDWLQMPEFHLVTCPENRP